MQKRRLGRGHLRKHWFRENKSFCQVAAEEKFLLVENYHRYQLTIQDWTKGVMYCIVAVWTLLLKALNRTKTAILWWNMNVKQLLNPWDRKYHKQIVNKKKMIDESADP